MLNRVRRKWFLLNWNWALQTWFQYSLNKNNFFSNNQTQQPERNNIINKPKQTQKPTMKSTNPSTWSMPNGVVLPCPLCWSSQCGFGWVEVSVWGFLFSKYWACKAWFHFKELELCRLEFHASQNTENESLILKLLQWNRVWCTQDASFLNSLEMMLTNKYVWKWCYRAILAVFLRS